jgi:hypothetical protein
LQLRLVEEQQGMQLHRKLQQDCWRDSGAVLNMVETLTFIPTIEVPQKKKGDTSNAAASAFCKPDSSGAASSGGWPGCDDWNASPAAVSMLPLPLGTMATSSAMSPAPLSSDARELLASAALDWPASSLMPSALLLTSLLSCREGWADRRRVPR